MPTTPAAYDIEIDAADGATAVDLELRLAHLTPTSLGRGDDWIVEIPGPANVDEIKAVVREWLDDVGQAATALRVDGHVFRIERRPIPRKPHLAPNRNFIG